MEILGNGTNIHRGYNKEIIKRCRNIRHLALTSSASSTVEEMMCFCVWRLQRGHSGDGCVLASTLCKYDLRKGNLFVMSWARVRRVSRVSLSSELLMCGGGVRSILLLPLVARCLETRPCLFLCML